MRVGWQGADEHLARDARMAPLVAALGPCEVEVRPQRFQALAESILYQQLAGSAASAICARVRGLDGGRFPRPQKLLAIHPARLRAAGVSPQKVRYLRGLARACSEGELDFRALARAGDEEVIAALTQLDGVGRWTAEMFLIFSLGRPDVWPVDDYGVRKGVQRLLGMKALPARRTMLRAAEPWRPYRSAAAWYLWRSQDVEAPGIR